VLLPFDHIDALVKTILCSLDDRGRRTKLLLLHSLTLITVGLCFIWRQFLSSISRFLSSASRFLSSASRFLSSASRFLFFSVALSFFSVAFSSSASRFLSFFSSRFSFFSSEITSLSLTISFQLDYILRHCH
jgi:hypothetical protein